MTQKYYRIQFVPDSRGRFGSIHAVELRTKYQLVDYVHDMVKNDLNSNKIHFKINEVEIENYSTEAARFEVIDANTQKYLGYVSATII